MNKEDIIKHYFDRMQNIRRVRFKERKKDICFLGISEHFICDSFYELGFRTAYKNTYKKAPVFISDWGPQQKQIRSFFEALNKEDRHKIIWDIYQDLLRLEAQEPLVIKDNNQEVLI